MPHRTAEESKKECIDVMGEELGSQYAELWQEAVYLHSKWMEYVTLYGSKPERIPLLNKAAPTFFRMVQDVFWDDALLHIARLTDPPASGQNKTNLTLRNLPNLTGDVGLRENLESLIKKLLAQSEFCRDWRNKLVAHRDLTLALNGAANQIEGGSRKQVDEILDTIAEILNAVSAHYLDATSIYRFRGHLGGALSLLYVLDDGLKLENERLERIMAGKGAESDFLRRNL